MVTDFFFQNLPKQDIFTRLLHNFMASFMKLVHFDFKAGSQTFKDLTTPNLLCSLLIDMSGDILQ